MAAASDISKVELAIEYTFKQKDLVTLSLTAAGAERKNHDGNRKVNLVARRHVFTVLRLLQALLERAWTVAAIDNGHTYLGALDSRCIRLGHLVASFSLVGHFEVFGGVLVSAGLLLFV